MPQVGDTVTIVGAANTRTGELLAIDATGYVLALASGQHVFIPAGQAKEVLWTPAP